MSVVVVWSFGELILDNHVSFLSEAATGDVL